MTSFALLGRVAREIAFADAFVPVGKGVPLGSREVMEVQTEVPFPTSSALGVGNKSPCGVSEAPLLEAVLKAAANEGGTGGWGDEVDRRTVVLPSKVILL